jgi:hypothetical protein
VYSEEKGNRVLMTFTVQLWTMNNYHYYLKSEFFPPRVNGAAPRFSCVRWHPEKENVLYLAGEGEFVLCV